jgi:hypothetical protein
MMSWFDCPAFQLALGNRPDKPLESNLEGRAVNVRFQNPATPKSLRPLRFQKRTLTAPIIQFDTFSRTAIVTAF